MNKRAGRAGRWWGSVLVCATLCVVVPQVDGVAGTVTQREDKGFKPVKLSHDLEVVEAQLGEFRFDAQTNTFIFHPQDRFDRSTHKSYGWRIKLRSTSARSIKVEEILTLPSAPKQWGISDASTISDDRKQATTTMRVSPGPMEYVSNHWSFSDGDPSGAHSFEVRVEGKEVVRFDFEVD